MTTTTTIDKAKLERWNVAVWNNAVWANAVKHAETRALSAKSERSRLRTAASGPSPGVSANIADVMACIRAHESGNYSEHSHLQDGSGAYQMVPRTFRSMSAGAGYPGYEYAYLAPPAVQDAVVAWGLTHGYAGAWSDKFGNDPCTAGLAGGG